MLEHTFVVFLIWIGDVPLYSCLGVPTSSLLLDVFLSSSLPMLLL